jgi:hypothetical protein
MFVAYPPMWYTKKYLVLNLRVSKPASMRFDVGTSPHEQYQVSDFGKFYKPSLAKPR